MLKGFWNRQPQPFLGVDIGSNSVKAVLLTRADTGYQLEGVAQMPVPKGAVVEHEIQDIEEIGNVVKTLRKRFDKKYSQAAVAVSGSSVMTKIVFMDSVFSEDELEDQIKIEADNLIPFPIDEVNLDFEVLGQNKNDANKVDVLLSASRSDTVESRVEAVAEAGLKTSLVDIEAYSLGRAVDLVKSQLPENLDPKVIAIVDIGANMTTFSFVAEGEVIYTREQVFGGEQLTQALMSYYGMEYGEAENAKLTGELPGDYTFEVLAPFQTSLIQQLRRTIQIFCSSSEHELVDCVILSGGGAQLEGMTQLLADEMGIPAIIANPFLQVDLNEDLVRDTIAADASKYMVACGLALRSFSRWHI